MTDQDIEQVLNNLKSLLTSGNEDSNLMLMLALSRTIIESFTSYTEGYNLNVEDLRKDLKAISDSAAISIIELLKKESLPIIAKLENLATQHQILRLIILTRKYNPVFVNLYEDKDGKFIGDGEYSDYDEAYKNRDDLSTYKETIAIVRNLDKA